jgi:hypothetical protein
MSSFCYNLFMIKEVSRILLKQEDIEKLTENATNSYNLNGHQIENMKIFNNGRVAMLQLLNDEISFLEIGVAAGDTSEFLCLNKKVNNVYLLDLYNDIDFYGIKNSSKPRYTPKTHDKFVYERISNIVNGQVTILKGTSQDLLPIDGLELDYVYIDGNHSYESVKLDLENSAKMIKRDGIIGIDDYINFMAEIDHSSISEYGVIRAVNEFLKDNHDFRVIGYAFNIHAPSIFIQRFPVV